MLLCVADDRLVEVGVGRGPGFRVGGNLLTGGYGSAAGGAIGSLIMSMSTQGIPFAGWNTNWRFLFLGVILLLGGPRQATIESEIWRYAVQRTDFHTAALLSVFQLAAVVAMAAEKSAREVVDDVFAAVQSFRGDMSPNDDMTAVAIRITA